MYKSDTYIHQTQSNHWPSKVLKRNFHWVIPIICAIFLLLPINDIPISPDGAHYIGIGLNLVQGRGFVDLAHNPISHRPLFPAMLSMIFAAGAPIYFGSFLLIRLFFLLNLLFVSLLGEKLFNRTTGLVAALLILTSYRLNEWSTWVNLDPVQPAFILAYIYFIHIGLTNKEHRWSFIGGILLGFGFLIKETAFIFLGVPFLFILSTVMNGQLGAPYDSLISTQTEVVIEKNSSAQSIQPIISWLRAKTEDLLYAFSAVCGFLLPVLCWGFYVQSAGRSFNQILGRSASDNLSRLTHQSTPIIEESLTLDLVSFLQSIPESLLSFYQWHLELNFVLAPLFLIAIVVLMITAIKSYSSRFLLCAIITYLPMVILLGAIGHRSAQSIVFYFLLYIALAYSLTIPFTLGLNKLQMLKKKQPTRNYGYTNAVWLSALGSILIALPLLLQFGWDVGGNYSLHMANFNTIAAIKTNPLTQKVRSPQPWWPISFSIQGSEKLALWLSSQSEQTEYKILGIENDNRYLNLATAGQHKFYQLRGVNPQIGTDSQQDEAISIVQFFVAPMNATFTSQASASQRADHISFLVHTQQSLLSTVSENNIDFVIVGHPEKWLANYLTNHPGFIKQAEFEFGALQVFSVIKSRLDPISIPTAFDSGIYKLLDDLEKYQPDRLAKLKTQYLSTEFSLDSLLFSESAESLPNNTQFVSFAYRRYGDWNLQTNNFENAIAIVSKKYKENPKNPWPSISLAALNEAKGRHESGEESLRSAIFLYRRALAIEPENWRAPWALLTLFADWPDLVPQDAVEEALNSLELRVMQNPESPRAYRELAVQYKHLGRMEQAEAVYQRAIVANAADGALYYSFGWFYETIGNIPAAIETYQIGLTAASKQTDVYRNMEKRLAELNS